MTPLLLWKTSCSSHIATHLVLVVVVLLLLVGDDLFKKVRRRSRFLCQCVFLYQKTKPDLILVTTLQVRFCLRSFIDSETAVKYIHYNKINCC